MSKTRDIDRSLPPSVAHKHGMNSYGERAHPDGLVPWSAARAPRVWSKWPLVLFDDPHLHVGRSRTCGYCGSVHPIDFAQAIRDGVADAHWADFKYGWPHKMYGYIHNVNAGKGESRMSMSHPPEPGRYGDGKVYKTQHRDGPGSLYEGRSKEDRVVYCETPKPAPKLDYAKFYTVHLMDATPEDREVIEQAMGLKFTFTDDGKVSWLKIGKVPA